MFYINRDSIHYLFSKHIYWFRGDSDESVKALYDNRHNICNNIRHSFPFFLRMDK